MARAPRKKFPGSPLDPKGSTRGAADRKAMRQGHPKPPPFKTRRAQKRWYKKNYKRGVVARGTGVVTTYKRGKLVKSNAGRKTLSQKKTNLARRRHRTLRIKQTGRAALGLGIAGVSAYAALSQNPATAKKTAAYTAKARGKATHMASTVKTKRNIRRAGGSGGGGFRRFRRDRRGRFA